jgi:hypothetical protein
MDECGVKCPFDTNAATISQLSTNLKNEPISPRTGTREFEKLVG